MAVPVAILLMLADDYGFNNVGYPHGPLNAGNAEMRTPNLDRLAMEGVRLERHYVYKYCSPTRSSLMSGRLAVHVNQNNDCNDIESPSGIDLRITMLPQKMKEAGFYTAMVGKWHGGARTPANLPINRGYDVHLGFLKGGEDHWNQHSGSLVDLWHGEQPAWGLNGTYSGYLYADFATQVVRNFTDSRSNGGAEKLFMYLPWHNTHTPLESPPEFMYPGKFQPTDPNRMTYNAMARCLDEGVGNVTGVLRDAGLWDGTLVIWSADNGGWVGETGSSNWPLRGSKVSDYEGGTRAVAFMSGGFLPPNIRGGSFTGYISVADWYGTLCNLVGVTPADPADGVPPVDSVDVWSSLMVSNGTSTPRTEIFMSYSNGSFDPTSGQSKGDSALIQGQYKIVIGRQNGRGTWQGPVYPNGTKDPLDDASCVDGCLFDIFADPTEHENLKATMPEVWTRLFNRLVELSAGVFQTAYAEPNTTCIPNPEADAMYRGFMGPQCFKHLPPAPPTPPSPPMSPPFALARGQQCLAPQSDAEKVSIVLGPCASAAGWVTNPNVEGWVLWKKTGDYIKVNFTAAMGPHANACVGGEVYTNPDNGPPSHGCRSCQGFAVQGGKLASSVCKGACIVANATHPVAHLGPCSSEDAVWSQSPGALF